MKILFVSTVHPSSVHPTMGTFNRVLLEAIRREGHEVRALVPVAWPRSGWRRISGERDITCFRWWYLPMLAPARMHRSLTRALTRAWTSQSGPWRPDLVLGYWIDPDGTAALELARRLDVPGVLLVGGTDANELAGTRRRGAVIRGTLRRASAIVTIGRALADRVVELGVNPDRVRSFRRGVDRGIFHPGSRVQARMALGLETERPTLVWAGRMVPVKGLETLLEALPQVEASRPPMLYLLGEGSSGPALRRQVAGLGIGDQVRFAGKVSHRQLGDWFRAADLVVLPSRSEGMPNVLLEALACGTPFVASNVGSVGELAESPDWLVPPRDPSALAHAIEHLLAEPPKPAQDIVDDRDAARRLVDLLIETVTHKPQNPDRDSA